MRNQGNVVGIIVIVLGLLILLGGGAVTLTTGATGGGMVLGLFLVLVVSAPVIGVGAFLLARSRADTDRQADSTRQRKILDMIKTRGQVDISDLVIELNSSTEQVRADIYRLVGMGLFTGYVNWDKGQLYSKEASQMRAGSSCPNCGGELSLGGKGVITCQYCGADIFL